jgi:hypothetical protein
MPRSRAKQFEYIRVRLEGNNSPSKAYLFATHASVLASVGSNIKDAVNLEVLEQSLKMGFLVNLMQLTLMQNYILSDVAVLHDSQSLERLLYPHYASADDERDKTFRRLDTGPRLLHHREAHMSVSSD